MTLLAPRAHAKLLEICAFLPHDLPTTMMGDTDRIRQVLMDGQIGVRSQPGVGSTFWFEIQLQRDPKEQPMIPMLKLHRMYRVKVLGIDDHEIGRRILQHNSEA